MPIPDFQTIMLPLLEMFKDGEVRTTTQMYAELGDHFGLSEQERTERLPYYVSRIGKKIVLIDGEQLSEMMMDHDVGVTTEDSYVVKKIDSDYFSEE